MYMLNFSEYEIEVNWKKRDTFRNIWLYYSIFIILYLFTKDCIHFKAHKTLWLEQVVKKPNPPVSKSSAQLNNATYCPPGMSINGPHNTETLHVTYQMFREDAVISDMIILFIFSSIAFATV